MVLVWSSNETFFGLKSVFPTTALEDRLCSCKVLSNCKIHQHAIVGHVVVGRLLQQVEEDRKTLSIDAPSAELSRCQKVLPRIYRAIASSAILL